MSTKMIIFVANNSIIMADLMKRVFVLLMMVAFLLPATGMQFFVHHCTAMNHSEYSLDGSNSCCGEATPLQKSSDQKLPGDFFNAQECCTDAQVLVKIDESYLIPESVPVFSVFAILTSVFKLNFTTESIPFSFIKRIIPNVFSDWVWLTNLSIRI
ncbi:MAG: hypothetical protein KUL83_11530 [Lentimicrobium sp.]|jgi:hypothetical protein|nr:hypothetical protein [Lentimicrobium sp.]MDD2526482.1 hypothetical protein [Lentimicrobiaceae bacterium]MDD4596384.1 hypothetical protein [Lentimicrobiaceae bacterium]MDY0025904.1 hypothetical protein [Lentimicrobium sp.]HAH56704.1 hypothetical protein [Bacteroidales bacterium]